MRLLGLLLACAVFTPSVTGAEEAPAPAVAEGDSTSKISAPSADAAARRHSIRCGDPQSLRDTKDIFIGGLGWPPPEIDWHMFCLCGPAGDESGYNSPGPANPESVPGRPGHGALPDQKPGAKAKENAEKKPEPCQRYEKEYAVWFSGYLSLEPGQAAKLAACQDQWHHHGEKAREMAGPRAHKKRDGKIGAGHEVKTGKRKLKTLKMGGQR